MKAATILPQPYVELAKDDSYHLALAHLIGRKGFNQYTDFFKKVGQDPNKFLILDNGLIEGDPRPIEELVAKAQMIKANELVLPDIFQNKDETLIAAHDALLHVEDVAPELGTMVVAQGSNLEEWIECAKEVLTWPIRTIGIPKVLVKMVGPHGRLAALERIQESLGDKEIHLLGCWESPIEVKTIANYVAQGKIKPVRGVDSAIAYVYARANLKMSEDVRPSGAIDFNACDADWNKLLYNIAMWREETADIDNMGKKIYKLY